MTDYMRSVLYVNFRKEAKYVYNVTQEEFRDLTSSLDPDKKAKSMTKRADWLESGTWYDTKIGDYHKLSINRDGKLFVYTSNGFDDSKNDREFHNTGSDARKLLEEKFKELNGITLKEAFGTCPLALSENVPASFYYVNRNFSFKNLRSVYKADFSANFPSNACGSLPDWRTAVQYRGTVKPSEDYPFAYYVLSHHVAEFGVFDTHDWASCDLYENLNFKAKEKKNRYEEISPDEDITVLCKKSSYELTDTLKYFYEKKISGDPDAKLVMNAALGTLHPNKLNSKFPKQHHIACIFIGRATARHMMIYEALKKEAIVLSMIVDSFIYVGSRQIGVDKKKMGALCAEVSDARFRMTSNINQYAFEKDGHLFDIHHGAISESERDINIESLEDIDKFDSNKGAIQWLRHINLPKD